MSDFFTLKFEDDFLVYIDQPKLPLEEEYITTDNYERIAEAIERLEIRGAPAIGIAAAYGVTVGMKGVTENYKSRFNSVYERLKITRPTAVNLFWALDEMKKVFASEPDYNTVYIKLKIRAIEIHNDDIISCDMIAKNGAELFENDSVILTHCNTGQLATGGAGTAFAVIKKAYELGFFIIEYPLI